MLERWSSIPGTLGWVIVNILSSHGILCLSCRAVPLQNILKIGLFHIPMGPLPWIKKDHTTDKPVASSLSGFTASALLPEAPSPFAVEPWAPSRQAEEHPGAVAIEWGCTDQINKVKYVLICLQLDIIERDCRCWYDLWYIWVELVDLMLFFTRRFGAQTLCGSVKFWRAHGGCPFFVGEIFLDMFKQVNGRLDC